MIKTYFFVPLTHPKYLQKAKTFKADHFVFDLEDAVSKNSLKIAYDNLRLIDDKYRSFIRPGVNWNKVDLAYLNKLYEMGFNNFIVPKATCFDHIKQLVDWAAKKNADIKFILLVENPGFLFDLPQIVKSFSKFISGLSLGSHDYCDAMNARYEYESYRFAHDFVLNLAKSYALEAIDTASMEIDDKDDFSNEVKRGFDKGYRSKFILHPKQLEYLDGIEYFSQNEINFARMVCEKINLDDFDAVKIEGKVLEKPHINRIKEILKYAGHGNE